MMRNVTRWMAAAFLASAPAAWAQVTPAPPPFQMRVQIGNTVQVLTDGATVAFAADGIGLPVSASIALVYTNTAANASASLNSITFSGSTDFVVSGVSNWPVTLDRNTSSTGIGVQYSPTTSRAQTAKIVFNFAQTVGPATTNGTFTLNLSGTAPEFAYSFIPQPNGNSTLLNSGDAIAFPVTDLLSTSSVIIVLANRGSGPGVVNNITYTGAPEFALASTPLPPVTVDPGKDARFQVQFTPDDFPPVSGSVRVDFVAGRTLNFRVTGSGKGAFFEYDVIQKNTISAISPDDTITLADVAIGEKSQAVVRVRNTGNADGTIRAISATGTGYSLTELPFLPAVLFPGASVTFTVNFTPTQAGRAPGKLRVGPDSFDLLSTGLGAVLAYGYVSGDSNFPLPSGASVVFTPVPVGGTSTVRVTITNNGTSSTAVNSISAGGPTTNTFTLAGVPGLPVNIGPGEAIGFNVTFSPATLGTINGTLRIDNQTFPLTGIGNAPSPLPGYTFQGASGTVDALSQPAVGLTLSANYPLDLTGTLTLAFNSEVFANDPSVQFATSGRTVAFTIPANTRQAVFANRATQIRLQSGTVAGTIVLTPSFTTPGGIDVTPTNPPALTLTVPQQAPVLLNVVLSAKTASSFTLLVTGYATSRSITQMEFTLAPTAGETVGTNKVTLNVEPSFAAWYQTTASQAFGSNFTVTVPFNLSGDVKKVTNVVDTIQSVSVTLTNRQGVSAAKSVEIK